jgi:calreticulin
MVRAALLVAAVIVACHATIYIKETFDNDADKWVKSAVKSDYGDMKVSSGKHKGDPGFQTSQDARFYEYSAKLDSVFDNKGKTLVFSFSVTHEQNIDCGGGYLKVMPAIDGKTFNGDSKYYIMFGPDICGHTKKIHLIFHYNGQNLLWKKEPRCESDEKTHFYTLILNSDNTYEVHVDGEKKESGNLVDDWDFLKPKLIDDSTDKKPSDWVDEAEIDDASDVKPEDWDKEAEQIKDPEAKKPDDWDEEEDGEWEAPTIPNPKYKGAWKAKRIPNPAYKGVWKPKQIANPEYKEDPNLYHFADSGAVGIDLWQVKSGSIFDNVLVSDDAADAAALFKDYKSKIDQEAKNRSEEEEKKKKEDAKKADEEKKDDKEDKDEDDDEDEDKKEDL